MTKKILVLSSLITLFLPAVSFGQFRGLIPLLINGYQTNPNRTKQIPPTPSTESQIRNDQKAADLQALFFEKYSFDIGEEMKKRPFDLKEFAFKTEVTADDDKLWLVLDRLINSTIDLNRNQWQEVARVEVGRIGSDVFKPLPTIIKELDRQLSNIARQLEQDKKLELLMIDLIKKEIIKFNSSNKANIMARSVRAKLFKKDGISCFNIWVWFAGGEMRSFEYCPARQDFKYLNRQIQLDKIQNAPPFNDFYVSGNNEINKLLDKIQSLGGQDIFISRMPLAEWERYVTTNQGRLAIHYLKTEIEALTGTAFERRPYDSSSPSRRREKMPLN